MAHIRLVSFNYVWKEMKVCSSSREMESLPAQETKGFFSQAEIRAQLLLH